MKIQFLSNLNLMRAWPRFLCACGFMFAGLVLCGTAGAANREDITIASSSHHRRLADTIIGLLKTISDRNVSLSLTSDDSETYRVVARGHAELGVTSRKVIAAAAKESDGHATFTETASFVEKVTYVLTPVGLELKTTKDLKRMRVAVGPKGSELHKRATTILAWDNVSSNVVHLKSDTAIRSLKEGKVDAIFLEDEIGSPQVIDLTTKGGMKLVSISETAFTKVKPTSGFIIDVLPKNIYPRPADEVFTPFELTVLILHQGIIGELNVPLRVAIQRCWREEKCAERSGVYLYQGLKEPTSK